VLHLDLEQLKALAQAADGAGCRRRRPHSRLPGLPGAARTGLTSVPSDFDTGSLRLLGTLRAPPASPGDAEEPTWEEYHPQGTRTDSATAPIAAATFPYNRSDL
jgi:hypothetical protein